MLLETCMCIFSSEHFFLFLLGVHKELELSHYMFSL